MFSVYRKELKLFFSVKSTYLILSLLLLIGWLIMELLHPYAGWIRFETAKDTLLYISHYFSGNGFLI